jgi:hypothetical protein
MCVLFDPFSERYFSGRPLNSVAYRPVISAFPRGFTLHSIGGDRPVLLLLRVHPYLAGILPPSKYGTNFFRDEYRCLSRHSEAAGSIFLLPFNR